MLEALAGSEALRAMRFQAASFALQSLSASVRTSAGAKSPGAASVAA
jgi:hypothetical protein